MTVTIDLKSKDKATGKHKTKDKNCLRVSWVKEVQGDVKKWLEVEYNLDFLELEDALQTCIERNSLELYPKVMQHFKSPKLISCIERNIKRCKNSDTIDSLKQELEYMKNM